MKRCLAELLSMCAGFVICLLIVYGNYVVRFDHVLHARSYRYETKTPSPRHKSKIGYENRPQRTSAVVVFTTMRSGSSFLGELFNQHPQVFYLFEPLHAFGEYPSQASPRKKALLDLARCNFTGIPDMYRKAINETGNNDISAKCGKENLCFAFKSRFLARDTDLCDGGKCRGPYDPLVLSEICRRSLFPAMKIIFEPFLNTLQPLMEDPSLNVKVIHLVRDPRAVIQSRKVVFTSYDPKTTFLIKSQSRRLCQRDLQNLKYANCVETFCDSNATFWKEKYLRLRYEDVSLRPLEAAKAVYNFVGLNFEPGVKAWIKKNTENSPKNSDQFSTSRNTSEAMSHWRKDLSFEEISEVQEECKEMMKILNYKEVLSPEQASDVSFQAWRR
ncbi:carbohydrate sulfotransferase 3-like [Clavelina lepadiformis]|uniref:Sulfotransferase n=1 Tax=Clavelina lepadiformis TaxID=159417 RepID=A0ABP0G045_CLALP